MFTPQDLRAIVARSSTLVERLQGRHAHPDVADHDAIVDSCLEQLSRRVAGADPVRFERYLRWHGWKDADVRRAFDSVVDRRDPLPEWARVLGQLDATSVPAAPPRIGEAEPFEDALAPFVALARHRLRARVPTAGGALDAAVSDCERGLVRQLARLASPTIFAAFAAFRLARTVGDGDDRRSFARALRSIGLAPRDHYMAFIADVRAGELRRLLLAHPVLARLLAMQVIAWADTTAESLRWFTDDRPALDRVFGGGREIGPIIEVLTDLSDPHRGGRAVIRVTVASGLHLVLKPRSLALEAAFSSLLTWLNDGRTGLSLKVPAVLDCGTHGWMEYIPSRPCRHAADVERYYCRSGMLLCLAYLLGGSDLHQGNVIACGEHPVLIDLEALMGAPLRPEPEGATSHEPNGHQIWDSVLRTGLLPVSRPGLRGGRHCNGGFVELDPGYGRRFPRWRHVNTDLMALRLVPPGGRGNNLPFLGDAAASADDYVDAVVGGFAEMAEALRRRQAEVTDPDGVLQAFRGVRSRVVLRDTGAYVTLLDRGLCPRLLRDGALWSLEFELLKATATAGSSRPASWSTWLAEQRALVRLDVPLFQSTTDGTAIEGDGDYLVHDFLAEPGYAAATAALADLSDERMQIQMRGIRLALRRRTGAVGAAHCVPMPTEEHEPWLSAATRIAKTLRSIADEPEQGCLDWIGIRGMDGTPHRGLRRLGWDLYGGRSGIALFFAALESRGIVLEEPSVAHRVLGRLVERLGVGTPPDSVSPDGSIGAAGCGGVVYGLTAASTLLRSDRLLTAALRAAETITPERIARDARLDVMSGTAGAALGLLALYRATPQPAIMDRAVLCGRHLLKCSRRPDPAKPDIDWPTADGRVTAGFAHGSAGIAYALARLYACTGIWAFRDGARAAFLGGGDAANRHAATDGTDAMAGPMRRSWCQGTAGLGLSRLEVSKLVGDSEILEGVDRLLDAAATLACDLSPSDTVCCGNMGSIELHSRASEVFDDPRWRAAAQTTACGVIERAARRHNYAVSVVDDVFCPGYYQGLAGIGYEFLRLHFADLPSVMLWE